VNAEASVTATPSDFDVEWSPADAALSWEWDDMHMPVPLAPLAADYAGAICAGIDWAYTWFGSPMRYRYRLIAGYAYMALDYGVPIPEVKAMVERVRDAYRAFALKTGPWWTTEAIPELGEIFERIQGIDADGLADADLASAWDDAWIALHRAWQIHFMAIRGPYRIVEDLADLYERVTPGAVPGEALALIQGANDVLQDVEAGIEGLVDLVAARPAIVDRLRTSPLPSPEELGQVSGGAEVALAIRTFLSAHGHLGQTIDDLTLPSWADEPALLLTEVAKRLGDPPERSAERRARLRVEAASLLDAVRVRLADEPDDLEAFERLFASAREIGTLTETHNYWIDRMAQARVRALALRVGRRLVRDGLIDRPEDVFYLSSAEVGQVLRSAADQREVVARRRREHARQQSLRPPATLGPPEPDFGLTNRFGVAGPETASVDQLKGIGASAGIARGQARVAIGPADFGRIKRGDIIVCPSSNPSWVPVFAIAGGLITNTGGVLAHAAVVAREFGLPAVVGVTGATTKIADGRVVEIDGSAGTVRLL
jgi:phosphohistidine swiveling domain-containing protein